MSLHDTLSRLRGAVHGAPLSESSTLTKEFASLRKAESFLQLLGMKQDKHSRWISRNGLTMALITTSMDEEKPRYFVQISPRSK